MTQDTRGHRVVEWADLVGESVPDGVADATERRTRDPGSDRDADRR
ncbi:hypothetical protein NDI76_00515 [Halogeometricum sp. S1BR25-6]|uniref:Uncharacterized protein n=1 Tax=Halogeometricum salsisoli TaxID=2950536 RepID=A0ABU2GAD1_9EURY|nr:hypothetical protein [Halogeometricum sp. S1BR25-6]MDS0297223.1 hypothetical protein [Halogeometricum sp. S1BR25-6]